MNKTAARTDETASQVDVLWQGRVDALISGECSEADFMAELASLRQSGADSIWSVLALLDQRYRRGQLPIALFRSIEAKIARRELSAHDYSTTVELDFVPAPAASKPQISRADPVDTVLVFLQEEFLEIQAMRRAMVRMRLESARKVVV